MRNKNNNCNNALVKRSIVIRLDAAHHLPQVPQQPQSQQRVATKSGTASSSRRQTVDSRQQKPAVVEWVRGWGGDLLGPVYRNAILMVLTKNRKANRRRGCHCHCCCCLCYPWLVRCLLLFTSRVGSAAVNSLVGSSRLTIRVYNAVHVCVCVRVWADGQPPQRKLKMSSCREIRLASGLFISRSSISFFHSTK